MTSNEKNGLDHMDQADQSKELWIKWYKCRSNKFGSPKYMFEC